MAEREDPAIPPGRALARAAAGRDRSLGQDDPPRAAPAQPDRDLARAEPGRHPGARPDRPDLLEPVEVEALRRLLTIELRPLPGIGGEGGQVLGSGDFEVKAVERAKRSDEQSYLVRLRQPVPDGRVALLRLGSRTSRARRPSFELALRSAVPFAVTELNCGRGLSKSVRDGITQCDPNESASEDGEERAAPKRGFTLAFSADPEGPDAVKARSAFRMTPPVDDLAVERENNRLRVSGRFRADTSTTCGSSPAP
jgi:hypothetical protein